MLNKKVLILTSILIAIFLEVYHYLWILDPVIAPFYDVVTQQIPPRNEAQILKIYHSFPKTTFTEVLKTDFGKFYGDKKHLPNPPDKFLKINWFDRYKYVVGNIRISNLLCQDGRFCYTLKTQYAAIDPKILVKLHLLLVELKKSISINSGYRTPQHNIQTNGAAEGSYHLYGKAVDISFGDVDGNGEINGADKKKIKEAIEKIDVKYPELCGGMGDYQSSLHIDTRGIKSRWAETKADRILVEKEIRRLTLFHDGQVLKTYRVALGHNTTGPKQCEGDSKTPEGIYTISGRNERSQFYRSLRISYPNVADSVAATKQGCKPGGDIMIHGLPNGFGWMGKFHYVRDWTNGCIAVTNSEIEEVWRLVPDGARIEIRP